MPKGKELVLIALNISNLELVNLYVILHPFRYHIPVFCQVWMRFQCGETYKRDFSEFNRNNF